VVVENFVVLREDAVAGLGLAPLPLSICAASIEQRRLVEVMRAWPSQRDVPEAR
jgi:DNA-binding transcriptional LysR family regulator